MKGIEVVDDVGGDINNLSFIALFHSNITRSVLVAKMGSFKITATPRALTPPPAAPLRLRDTHDAPSPERQFMCIRSKTTIIIIIIFEYSSPRHALIYTLSE
jgi:hypothetical protein